MIAIILNIIYQVYNGIKRDEKGKNTVSKVPTGTSGSSSSWSRFPVSSSNLAVEIFDGTGHFGMWQGEVLDSLFQQGLGIAIEEH